VTFLETMKHLTRKGLPVGAIKDDHLVDMFDMLSGGSLVPEAIPTIIEFMARNMGQGPKEAVDALGLSPLKPKELEERVLLAIRMFKGDLSARNSRDALMGVVMAEVRGRVPGKVVNELIKNALTNVKASA
jgi:glutamyl-tRNA(Gln) amidotransferase subunit E